MATNPNNQATQLERTERQLAGVVAEVRRHERVKREREATRIEDRALHERVRHITTP